MEYSDAYVKKLLQDLYDGTYNERNLPEDLYFRIADYLKKGVYSAWNKESLIDFEGKDLELVTELRENVYMFSAAKTFQQTKEITDYLIDNDGNIVSFDDFFEKASAEFEKYNRVYAQTEYDTAIGQAQSAIAWDTFEQEKDVLSNLEYVAVLDPNTSDICEPLNGIIAPVDDPIWDTIAPLNHFKCRCVLQATEKDVSDNIKEQAKESIDNMDDVFKNNPGKSKQIFSKDHPYFQVGNRDKAYAKRNFDLPIPETDA